jgi:plastocyanin
MGSAAFLTANASQQPVSLSVAANVAVTWINDSGSVDHNVTFDDPTTALAVGNGAGGTFNAPIGSTNQRKFSVSGSSHPFHCTIHNGMSGVVNVQ